MSDPPAQQPICGKRFRRSMSERPFSRTCTKPPHEGGRHSDRGHLSPPKESDTPEGTCQVCFKPQKCPNGGLSLHGYRRPGYGWIEGKCWGVRGLPYEQSCNVTKEFLRAILLPEQVRTMEHLRKLQAGEYDSLLYAPYHLSWKPAPPSIEVAKGAGWVGIEGHVGSIPSYAELQRRGIREAEQKLRALASDIRFYTEKVTAWKAVPWPVPKATTGQDG